MKLFISYSNRDRATAEQLVRHLEPLLNSNGLELFYDVLLAPGDEWHAELERRLLDASIVLFLVSPNWLGSELCQRELRACLQQDNRKLLVPILLSPCEWQGSAVSGFRVLPRDGRPISLWSTSHNAFVDIASGLLQAVEAFRGRNANDDVTPSSHTSRVTRIVVTSDGGRAVSRAEDGTVYVWDLLTMRLAAKLFGPPTVADATVLPDGDTLVAVSFKGSLVFQSLSTLQVLEELNLPGIPTRVAASKKLVAMRLQTGGVAFAVPRAPSWTAWLHPLRDQVTEVEVFHGDLLLAASEGKCEWWDTRGGTRMIRDLKVAAKPIRHIRPIDKLDMCVSSCESGMVQVFDASGPKREFKASEFPANAIAPLTDGRRIVVACQEGLRLFDLTNGALLHELALPDDPPTAVDVTPDDQRAIWGSTRGKVSAWPIVNTPAHAVPEGRDRLKFAYLAVLEQPELWRMLETLDENALRSVTVQLAIPPGQDALEVLISRHPDKEPPPLWAAWMETLYASRLGQGGRKQ